MYWHRKRGLQPLATSVLIGTALCLFTARTQAQTAPQSANQDCNGTVSFNRDCNTTAFNYPAGCYSGVPADRCTEPLRGLTCRQIPEKNTTCLTAIVCSNFKLPPNSFRKNVKWPSYGEVLEIECNPGYERSDGRGFSTTANCTDSGNFTVRGRLLCLVVKLHILADRNLMGSVHVDTGARRARLPVRQSELRPLLPVLLWGEGD
jgi:hypothetical protein